MVSPLFILSLPRAGSTLLQRLLVGSGNCATLGEPSLLLRFLGGDDVIVRHATYWEFLVSAGIKDSRQAWAGFDEAYCSGVRNLMTDIYSGLAGDKEWFIDKTPRYSLIAEEIIKVFPQASILVLWRHPLAVAASLNRTSERRFWCPDEFSIDLYEGLTRLYRFSCDHANAICQVRYEDLCMHPKSELQRIGAYLGWNGLEQVVDEPLVPTAGGTLGDQTGVKKFQQISIDSVQSWQTDYNNWYRRCWARRYFSGERLSAMQEKGYEYPERICNGPMRFLAGILDCLRASNRISRRLTHPLQVKRFCRQFRKQHGYGVEFR